MKYFIISTFLVLCNPSNAQKVSVTDIPMRLGNAGKDKLLEEYADLLRIDSFPYKMYWSYYLKKSNFHLYLEKDSVAEYLDLAFKDRPKAVCGIIYKKEKLIENRKKVGKVEDDFSWYLTDLPSEVQRNLRNKCIEIDAMTKEKKRGKVSALEKRIMTNDQDGRMVKEINWEEQNKKDKENRRILDSLYDVHSSFQNFNKYELDAFSFVLHHSNDCEWNMKWFNIWLTEKQKGFTHGGKMLGPAFERMLTKGKGCWIEDPEGVKALIEKLKEKYPSDYAQKFGYNNF